MEEAVHLVMERLMLDIPIFDSYNLVCNKRQVYIELWVDNMNCDWNMKYIREIDYHRYFKLLGLSPSDYYIDLKCMFSPADHYDYETI